MKAKTTLAPKHKKRLAELAISLLKHSKETSITIKGQAYDFEMSSYAADDEGEDIMPNEIADCGTSCCFLGYAPLAFGKKMPDFQTWTQVENWVIGPADETRDRELEWYWLFDSSWSNNPTEAAARALMLLETDCVHHTSMEVKTLAASSKKELIARLKVYSSKPATQCQSTP